MKLIKVCNDLFDVSNRLKQIDSEYVIYFNKDKNLFEVHHKKQRGGSFAFVVGKNLNAAVLKKAVLTSIKFAGKILKQIERDNFLLEKRNIDKATDENMIRFKFYIDYANSKNCDVDFSKMAPGEWI